MSSREPKTPSEMTALALSALGVVFGDIGTSILYTFQECFHGSHPLPVSPTNVLGITSLILWSLIWVVTVKYIWVLLNAENKGEGGILSLMSLVPARFRFKETGGLATAALLGVAGAALLFGDGIITPAISVLSAMEGLEHANPAYSPYVMPGTIAILAGLFMIQSRGTGRIGGAFGAIVLVWFAVTGIMGVKHILQEPHALRAFSPWYAVEFFKSSGWSGVKVLGAVILAVTGGEALYADMGHFGKKPIRFAWLGIVFPSLILNYLGQAALLLQHPEVSHRPFYSMIDVNSIWYYPLVALATAATIIASQALITGAFSLTHQSIRLGIFPRVKVVHTSAYLEGRVYIPFMNWLLALSCIATVLFFQRSTRLAAAYGLAVSGTMLLTTMVFYYVALHRWRWAALSVFALIIPMLLVDLAFLYANIEKIPDGGYLPVIIGIAFFSAMVIWQLGRAKLSKFYRYRSKNMDHFFEQIKKREIRRIPGTLVVLASAENRIPPVLTRAVDSLHVLHEHVLFVTVVTADDPYVPQTERIRITDLSMNVSRVRIDYGFMETPDIPAALAHTSYSHLKTFPQTTALYLIGRETFVIDGDSTLERLKQWIFAIMSRNSSSASDYFKLPIAQVLELGTQLSV